MFNLKTFNMSNIKICPTVKSIFIDNEKEYSKHFRPFATINLGNYLDSKLAGKLVHIVHCTIDPYCESSHKFYNEFCNESKLTFEIIGKKYRLKADFGLLDKSIDYEKISEIEDESYKQFKKRLKVEYIPDYFLVKKGRKPKWLQNDETPLNSKGRKMTFICQMQTYPIIQGGDSKEVYLFYDDLDKVAVQIFQIT